MTVEIRTTLNGFVFNLNCSTSPYIQGLSVFLVLLLHVIAEFCSEGSILLGKEGQLSLFYSFCVK